PMGTLRLIAADDGSSISPPAFHTSLPLTVMNGSSPPEPQSSVSCTVSVPRWRYLSAAPAFAAPQTGTAVASSAAMPTKRLVVRMECSFSVGSHHLAGHQPRRQSESSPGGLGARSGKRCDDVRA